MQHMRSTYTGPKMERGDVRSHQHSLEGLVVEAAADLSWLPRRQEWLGVDVDHLHSVQCTHTHT